MKNGDTVTMYLDPQSKMIPDREVTLLSRTVKHDDNSESWWVNDEGERREVRLYP